MRLRPVRRPVSGSRAGRHTLAELSGSAQFRARCRDRAGLRSRAIGTPAAPAAARCMCSFMRRRAPVLAGEGRAGDFGSPSFAESLVVSGRFGPQCTAGRISTLLSLITDRPASAPGPRRSPLVPGVLTRGPSAARVRAGPAPVTAPCSTTRSGPPGAPSPLEGPGAKIACCPARADPSGFHLVDRIWCRGRAPDVLPCHPGSSGSWRSFRSSGHAQDVAIHPGHGSPLGRSFRERCLSLARRRAARLRRRDVVPHCMPVGQNFARRFPPH